jgi:hypothetical protein
MRLEDYGGVVNEIAFAKPDLVSRLPAERLCDMWYAVRPGEDSASYSNVRGFSDIIYLAGCGLGA